MAFTKMPLLFFTLFNFDSLLSNLNEILHMSKMTQMASTPFVVNLVFVLDGVVLGLLNSLPGGGWEQIVPFLFLRPVQVALGQQLFLQEKVFDVRDKGQKIKIAYLKLFHKTLIGITKFLRPCLLLEKMLPYLERRYVYSKEAISNNP